MGFLHLNRRTFGLTAGVAAACAAVPALRAQARIDKSRITVAVSCKASLALLPLTIAEQLDYFREEGLNVVITDYANGDLALQAVQAGAADVCCGAFEKAIYSQGTGHALRSFVLMGRAPQISVGVSKTTLYGFEKLADLKGTRIGVSATGSSTEMVARLLLAQAGIRPAEVLFVPVGTGESALSALRAGRIDVLSNTDPVMTMLEQKGEVKLIADTRTVQATQTFFGGNMPAACLFAPQAFLRNNPVAAQALAHAVVHSLKWLQTAGPADLIKAIPEPYWMGERGLYLAAFNNIRDAVSTDGTVPVDGPATALSALARIDSAFKTDQIDLSQLFTNALALKAKQRFNA